MLKPSALFVQKGIAVALLVLAVLFVYKGSLNGVFVFDDIPAIVENPTLRSPVRWDAILFPPGDQAGTVGGRPLVNATLAINYALGGLNVRGYHQVNLVIHLLSALTLLGIVGRTLSFVSSPNLPKLRLHSESSPPISARRSPFVTGESEGANLWTAFAVALLWAVHPLQTESVTYVVQRAESLMGLFYLFRIGWLHFIPRKDLINGEPSPEDDRPISGAGWQVLKRCRVNKTYCVSSAADSFAFFSKLSISA